MSPIRRLPPEVVNKIAAGEVVERPGSVVKELLENAIDAGATRIDVALSGGGSELIRVVDNGCGIAPHELELAVANHSTSKIASAEDLIHIRTLGFRGEALAAIAAVSRLTIRSRTSDAVEGAEIYLSGGVKEWLRPCGCPPGTSVEVRDLFFNTPVRRRFLRGVTTELAHACEAFIRVALAYPQLHLTLWHNDRPVFDLVRSSTALERIAALFGQALADRLLPVESVEGPVRLWGFVGHPQDSKTTSRFQYLFINGRYFRDKALQHALTEAYRGLLTVGRYPVAFLWLEMPPELVDVNVHPTKLEVRFIDAARLYGQLLSTLRARFLSPEIGARISGPASPFCITQSMAVDHEATADSLRQRIVDWAQGKLASWLSPEGQGVAREPSHADSFSHGSAGSSRPASFPAAACSIKPLPYSAEAKWESIAQASATEIAEKLTSDCSKSAATDLGSPELFGGTFARLGGEGGRFASKAIQVMDSFLVTECPEGILLIDQHALHEKILTVELLDQLARGKVIAQSLVVPEPVDLSADEAAILLENRQLLEKLGLEIEPFGGSTVLVQAYPAVLKPAHFGELLREIAQALQQTGQLPDRPRLFERLAASLACKAAVKAGQPLTPEEISDLIAQSHLVRDSYYCPHGRPAMLVLSKEELERYFRRS